MIYSNLISLISVYAICHCINMGLANEVDDRQAAILAGHSLM